MNLPESQRKSLASILYASHIEQGDGSRLPISLFVMMDLDKPAQYEMADSLMSAL
jgi:hypothetical protein